MAIYAYDGNAKRVKTVLANGSTEYVFYDLNGKLRCALKGNAKIDYIDLDGQPFVERNSIGKDVTTGTAPLKTTYLHPDWIGSPRMATDFSGTVRWREHFDPYGKKLNGVAEKRGFTGHSFDPETGLTYMLARYYDAEVGRFLQTDPIGSEDDLNLYAYVKGDPVNSTDPTGEVTCGDPRCETSTFSGVVPRSNSQPPPVNEMFGIRTDSSVRQKVEAGYATTVTFKNDNPNGASPNQPISTATVSMVEGAISKAGVDSVNVNSTIGGEHSEKSLHYREPGQAVDINRVNGERVDNPANRDAVSSLQNAAAKQPGIRENFGPTRNDRTSRDGTSRAPSDKVIKQHRDHVHIGGPWE